MDGLDIKMIIAETELFAIHHKDLVSRPGDFGRDFLGRVLPACLFQSVDYVQALREHRRYIAEMKPLFEKYDVLLTCGFGPAPRLDAHSTPNFWRRSNVFTPSNVGRTPALVLCGGFSRSGLPLGMQLIGRPFDDARVLKVGHAYQCATDWHKRHPQLEPGTRATGASGEQRTRAPGARSGNGGLHRAHGAASGSEPRRAADDDPARDRALRACHGRTHPQAASAHGRAFAGLQVQLSLMPASFNVRPRLSNSPHSSAGSGFENR